MKELAQAHIEAQARLRHLAVEGAGRAWQQLPKYDRADVPQFLRSVVPLVTAAQRQSVALTNMYLARHLHRQPVPLDIARLTGAGVRKGATPQEVYSRPFVTVWAALGEDKPWRDAVAAGLDRVTAMAATDVQLAMRATLQEVAAVDARIIGYERVPDGNACDLCQIASTQRYYSSDLMPIHDRCGCGVEPITGTSDSGRVINPVRYETLKTSGAIDAITEQRQSARLESALGSGVEVAVHDHGELGPVLANAADHFTHL